jgi:hypothetical protein
MPPIAPLVIAPRVFLSPDGPLGFGAADWIELAVAAVLVVLPIRRTRVRAAQIAFAQRTIPCMLVLFALRT